MGIPNAKKYRIHKPDGTDSATIVAVLPKNVNVDEYLAGAAQRFNWQGLQERRAQQNKIRVGQQKQKKRS